MRPFVLGDYIKIPPMNDNQLLRYSRHILLDEIGIEGQQRLLAAHTLVIGAGGLGSPVALYLGTAGVGTITVVDHDAVDVTNLQRQIAHNLARVGRPKAESVREAIGAINPDVLVRPIVMKVDAQALDEIVPHADVVVDCCDNFATRQAINRACFAHGKPLVSGAAIRMDGQVSAFDPRQVVRDLALQVGEVHHVVVDQRDAAHAGGAEVQRHRRAEAACADHDRVRGEQALLPFHADLLQQDVARIAKQLFVGHARIVHAFRMHRRPRASP